MYAAVHKVVERQYQPWFNLPLHTYVNLCAVRRFVIRIEDAPRNHALIDVELGWRARHRPVGGELCALCDVGIFCLYYERNRCPNRSADTAIRRSGTWLYPDAVGRRIENARAVDGTD